MSENTGIVNIHGKEYFTVAKRIEMFREKHGMDVSVVTKIVENTPNRVVMKCKILHNGAVIATGHAEEIRASSQINKTSAMENCETSAIGRALACLGFGGTEFASANEVEQAIHQREQPFTADQKLRLDELMAEDASFDLYIWNSQLPRETQIALHNSFQRPNITKMKDKMTDMMKTGQERFHEYQAQLAERIESTDSHGCEELWYEMGEEAGKLIWKELDGEQRNYLKEVFK